MPTLLFSGFILDRQHGCRGTVTGSKPRRVRQSAASNDRLQNAAHILYEIHALRASRSGGMHVVAGGVHDR
jgi:hypothetical protein